MSKRDKRDETIEFFRKFGWVDLVHWGNVSFIFKKGEFKAITKSGVARDLKKSEKEQLSVYQEYQKRNA